jgi:hypothetical protein
MAAAGEEWRETWIRIDADGSIHYPRKTLRERMPPWNSGELACAILCLVPVRERRTKASAVRPA